MYTLPFARRTPSAVVTLAACVMVILLSLTVAPPRPAAAGSDIAPTGQTEILSAGSYHTCAVTPAGAVDCWGYNADGRATDQPGPFSEVSAGRGHTCALTPAGALDCWGGNDYGQATDRPGPYTQVSAGEFHTCALTPSGAVDCWGDNHHGQAVDQTGPYTQVSAGLYHTCALTPSGAVDCWGGNGYGESIDQPGPYTHVSAGEIHTCALTPSGAVDCWGNNDYGQATDQAGPYGDVPGTVYVAAAAGIADNDTEPDVFYSVGSVLRWSGFDWTEVFDSTDHGLPATADISALAVIRDTLYLNWRQTQKTVPGLGTVTPWEVVRFNRADRTFSRFFDGRDVGLTTSGEYINGLEVLDGSQSPVGSNCLAYLLISTVTGGQVSNPAGALNVFSGEDVLGFCMTQSGAATTGIWHPLVDGQPFGLPRNATLGLAASRWMDRVYFTTKTTFLPGSNKLLPFTLPYGPLGATQFEFSANGLTKLVDSVDYIE